jgi:hypothetical protein
MEPIQVDGKFVKYSTVPINAQGHIREKWKIPLHLPFDMLKSGFGAVFPLNSSALD